MTQNAPHRFTVTGHDASHAERRVCRATAIDDVPYPPCVQPPKSVDPKLLKWQKQIERIGHHVIQLNHDRQLWREMTAGLATATPEADGTFIQHYTKLYVDGASMAVRRLADVGGQRQTIALGRLIADLIANSKVLNREVIVARYTHDDDPREWAREDWRRRGEEFWQTEWADAEDDLDVVKLRADVAALTSAADKVASFADRVVAHIDSRGAHDIPTFADLDDAINLIGDLFKRYSSLIDGKGWAFLEPAIQGDWKAPFRRAVFEPIPDR